MSTEMSQTTASPQTSADRLDGLATSAMPPHSAASSPEASADRLDGLATSAMPPHSAASSPQTPADRLDGLDGPSLLEESRGDRRHPRVPGGSAPRVSDGRLPFSRTQAAVANS